MASASKENAQLEGLDRRPPEAARHGQQPGLAQGAGHRTRVSGRQDGRLGSNEHVAAQRPCCSASPTTVATSRPTCSTDGTARPTSRSATSARATACRTRSSWSPASVKIELIHRLQAAGIRRLEATSFVSPKWIPQMADNAEVLEGLQRRADVAYAVLVPNDKGLQAALPHRPDEIVVFTAASEAFTQKNINCSIAESIERFAPVVAAAKAQGIKVRAALSCALGCPYEGEIHPDKVDRVSAQLRAIGVDHIGVSDTIGVGTPRRVQAALEAALKHFPLRRGQRPLPRHLWPGAGQRLRQPGARRRDLRCQRRWPGRLPLREGGDRQCRDRGCGLHAERSGHRDRGRPRRPGRHRGLDQ